MEATNRWSTPSLAAFLAAVAESPDETSATRRALDWATEALGAEIGVVLEGEHALASAGCPRGNVSIQALSEAIADASDLINIPGSGVYRLASTRLEMTSAVDLLVARSGVDPFSREEVDLLHAGARSLTLTVRLHRAVLAERAMRDDLRKRQALFQRLSSIQHAITRRLPLMDVLNTITRCAVDLLDAEVAAVRLVDPQSPGDVIMVSQEGIPPEIAASMHRSGVGEGVGGRAIAEDRLVIVDDYPRAKDMLVELREMKFQRAMAAPVRDGDLATGSIVVATTRSDLVFGPIEQEVLSAFAEHASLAITDAKRVEHIQKLAFHDDLTGLPNRGLFLERVEQALTRARRRRNHVAVLFLDLDRFKTVNDSLGHAGGDQLLVAVGERLRHCLRGEDTAARLGGDEFAILAHCDRKGAAGLVQRILRSMEPLFVINQHEVSASASIGIALNRDGRIDADGMLRDADKAMYRAKFNGSDGFAFFEQSMHAAALARIDLEADLRRAVMRDEMRLAYQPIVNLSDGELVGVEAQIRWHHHRGVMFPVDFIPLAEETGQIAALGGWTLHEACAQARRWPEGEISMSPLTMSVNVSPRQLQDSRFVRDVADALDASGLDPARLVLEITEGAVMVDEESATLRLQALHGLGVSLAIDDFGTGHSSLALLRRLPLDIIKVDKLFVDTIATDPVACHFLETIVRMGAVLSLSVVVEGVETARQADLIATMGAGVLGQGYHLGRPMTAGDVKKLLSKRITAAVRPLTG